MNRHNVPYTLRKIFDAISSREDGDPIQFTEEVSTAGIMKTGKMLANPKFWASLNETEQEFIIAHEMAHLLYRHHSRFPDPSDNAACDFTINSMLTHNGFRLSQLPNLRNGGCFPSVVGLPELQTTAWYKAALSQGGQGQTKGGGDLETGDLSELEDAASEIVKKAGIGKELFNHIRKDYRERSNESFAKYVKDVSRRRDTRFNRYDLIERVGGFNHKAPISASRLFMPYEILTEDESMTSRNVAAVYVDVSSSCEHLQEYFLEVLRQIPRKYFRILAYTFNTEVREIDPRSDNHFHGGGTCFDAVVSHANELDKDLVFVITDGHSSAQQKAKKPSDWIWFISEGGTFASVPKGCHAEPLSRFVVDTVSQTKNRQ
jgi:hypothetical protein